VTTRVSLSRLLRDLSLPTLRHADVCCTMDQKLAEFASLNQKDKAPAYLSLLSDILARPDQALIPADLHRLVDTVVNQESVGLVASRQVLAELVKSLDEKKIADANLRKQIIEDTLQIIQTRQNSYDEQVMPRARC
jgi:COP9 signalosome complex subunit 4